MVELRADQLKQLKDIFARFDMDSDGSLTVLELAALLRSLGLKLSGDQIHVLLSNMDSNGNEELMEVFRLFDRDGNGIITAAELAGCMAKMGHPLKYKELIEMMREADSDGDGVISFSEFSSVMAKSALDFLGVSLAT
ncbi:putative calcium-binding protein CML12 [Hibiscus syriacus]|uniref:Calcium-binding protein CML12 n=1 Tax=Hibiscus syriacus TaxID=106335 RepID=A0A6A2ZPK9_HIBSY|nr:putative calcium-binding protein CML12 [Hibiscus syriacus]